MNEHLTEQQLIDYQFKLADDGGPERGHARTWSNARNVARGCKSWCGSSPRWICCVARSKFPRTCCPGPLKTPCRTVAWVSCPCVAGPSWPCKLVFHGREGFPKHIRSRLGAPVARGTHGQDARATLKTASPARRSRVIWLYRVPALGRSPPQSWRVRRCFWFPIPGRVIESYRPGRLARLLQVPLRLTRWRNSWHSIRTSPCRPWRRRWRRMNSLHRRNPCLWKPR